MALSGTVNLTSNNQYISGKLTWSATQNITDNYSDVYVEMRMWRTNSGYTTNGSGTWNININGTNKSESKSITLTYNSNTLIMSHTVRVYHNSDGTKTFTLNCGGGIPSTSYDYTYCNGGSGVTLTLDTIPRASAPTLSAGTTALGSSVTINTNRVTTAFTHIISYSFGSIPKTTISGGVGASVAWTIPNDLANQIPSAVTGVGTIYCDTYNGATYIGTKTTSFTVSVPNNSTFKPTIGTITNAETVASVTALALGGKYAQALSNIRFTIPSISGKYNATVSTVNITFNGGNYTSPVASGSSTWNTGVVSASGTLNYSITVTDSRGYTSTASTGSVVVLPYATPLISSFTAKRCDVNGNEDELGTYLKIVRNGSASSLKDTLNAEKNTLACKVEWSLKGQNSWTVMSEMAVPASGTLTATTTGIKSTKTDFAITDAYDIKFTLTDKFNNTVSTQVVTVGTVVMSWGQDGVGIGKVWEQGALDVKGDMYVDGNLFLGLDKVTAVKPDGVMEIGRYIDFHYDGNPDSPTDYDVRLEATADTLILHSGSTSQYSGLQVKGASGITGNLWCGTGGFVVQSMSTASLHLGQNNSTDMIFSSTAITVDKPTILTQNGNAFRLNYDAGNHGYMEFNEGGVRRGWMGNGSASNDDITLNADVGHALMISASGNCYLKSFNSDGVNNRSVLLSSSQFGPNSGMDNKLSLGQNALRWTQLYAVTATIATSDRNQKTEIGSIPDEVLNAWAEVGYCQFKFIDAVAEKGIENARFHLGVIAQEIEEAFLRHGLDAFKYGLLCYDEWEADYDEEGNLVAPAGNMFSIRADECQFLEMALQRRTTEELQARLAVLESK